MSVIVSDAKGNKVKVAGLGGGSSANAVTVPGGAAITMGEGIGAGGYQFKFTPEGDEPDLTASDVGYDHAESGLAATTVQDAVDEVAGRLAIDGVPVGTVISFLGLTAPEGYLVCDGASYSISDYPALSAFIAAQFGSANHFGGDGTATFAVPDLRNLFLRGYHGTAEEQLSGDVGARQEGTEHSNVYIAASDVGNITSGNIYGGVSPDSDSSISRYTDRITTQNTKVFSNGPTQYDQLTFNIPANYTARPVNMAVLYCIKSV